MTNRIISAAIPLCFFCLGATCHAEDKITLNYNERPPYIVPAADGSATGLTATPAANAFSTAGIPVTWTKIPPNRQLIVVQENKSANCAIGWFKNSERETFAKFSKPIYRDHPTILLANKAFQPKPNASLAEILSMPGARVLIKEKFSYGAFVDGLLAKIKPNTVVSNGSSTQMLQLINARSADFMFVSEEEAQYLVDQASLSMKNFSQVLPSDMPAGAERYLMCSKSVPDEVITRINKAITFK